MEKKPDIDVEAGFDQLKTRIERTQRNRKLRMIWWMVLLAAMSIAVSKYVQHWL
jgi:hypothetical protein